MHASSLKTYSRDSYIILEAEIKNTGSNDHEKIYLAKHTSHNRPTNSIFCCKRKQRVQMKISNHRHLTKTMMGTERGPLFLC